MERLLTREIRDKVREHELWLQGDEEQGIQADFSEKFIRIADLHGAHLAKSIFVDARLRAVEFVGADLSGANFEGAELKNVDFHNATLSGVKLKGATFKNVHISEQVFNMLEEQLTIEQLEGITISYGRFMFLVFFTW